MATQYKIESDGSVTITMNFKPEGSMLDQEEQIAQAVAEMGRKATTLSLQDFDTDGRPIVIENVKHTSRGKEKSYQTPYGEVEISRHVYQPSSGGRIVVPLEKRARVIARNSTPRFAQMVSWKYTQLSAAMVVEDLALSHCRKTSRKLIQRLSAAVGELAREKEFEYEYELPEFEEVVTHVVISRDGTTTPILGEGYRETMCGTISFYSGKGERLHTIYTACAPEYGKATFDSVLDMEIENVKSQYPKVKYVGLADGSKDNWSYLQPHTGVQILDFYHAAEYLSDVSVVLEQTDAKRKEWMEGACHDLKHQSKGAANILRELKHFRDNIDSTLPEILNTTITYFENNQARMKYAAYQKQGYPIGSGVTEAACKVVAKQRLCRSGMRWNIYPVQQMLLLRGLVCTPGRWRQFWCQVDENGL